MENELLTEIVFDNYGDTLTVRCPDEDDEMQLIINDSSAIDAIYLLTIEKAVKLRDYLGEHIANVKEVNK